MIHNLHVHTSNSLVPIIQHVISMMTDNVNSRQQQYHKCISYMMFLLFVI